MSTHTTFKKPGKTSLVPDDIRSMRKMASDGIPRSVIAEKHGISTKAVGKIVRFETWKEVY